MISNLFISCDIEFRALFRRQSLKTIAHNLGAFDHVDESVRVKEAEIGFQLHQVGAVQGNVNHLALGTLVEATACKHGAAAIEVL